MRDRLPTVLVWALFTLVCCGLFYTQIARYSYYSRLSRNNSVRIIPINGPRGNMVDRKGRDLVTNRLSFDIVVVYNDLRDKARLINLLKDILGMQGGEIARCLEKAASRPYAAFAVAEDIDKVKAIRFEEERFGLEGVTLETRSRRNYIYENTGSHIFGYLSEVSEDELEELKDSGYRMRDLVGRSGLEKYYETYLKGSDGGAQVEVDSMGRQTQVLGLKEPVCGNDLHLTIDIDLQVASDKLLGDRAGAVIVIDPATGEVLALASHPSFDPNVFVKPKNTTERLRLLRDRRGRPMSNRAISGLYAPGSVFKIVTASAALETGKINHNTCFICSGSFRMGRRNFKCWKEEGHGSQNIENALMNSCNVFFYNAGKLSGVDAIEAYAKLFGFGKLTGIDLPDEVKGLVPGRSWKRLFRKDNWYEGETINYAIGQGYLLVTPIQIVAMMSVMANGGSIVKPYIVKKAGDISTEEHPEIKRVGLKSGTINEIRRGLNEVVNNEFGTGKRAKAEGVLAAGKTGTAQNPQGRSHAWFAGFAPYDHPKICVVVFLEHGGKGGVGASEIAGKIFEEAKRVGYL